MDTVNIVKEQNNQYYYVFYVINIKSSWFYDKM